MMVDKGKKAKVAENGGDENDHIDGDLVLSIERLQEIQDEIEKVNEEASDKVLEVEQKYNEIRRPVYAKRSEIIKAIPDFWLTAFMSHPALGELLNEEDEKIFKNLVSLDVEDSRDVKSGYSITFTFSPNPYFEDTKLTKAFSFSDDGTTSITGTKITWKEGKDIANGPGPKKDGKRSFHDESFFAWFAETQNKNLPDGFSDEVAEIIKEDLWPNPLKYFNNEVDDDELEEIEDDEEEGSEDDDDDGEDDDDDDQE